MELDGGHARVAVVVARFNAPITEGLLWGVQETLSQHGVAGERLFVQHVPGAFEIPLVAKALAVSGRFNVVIALGCVIRGDTDHYDYVCQGVTHGVLQAGLETGVPVIFGVLTTDTTAQAEARAGKDLAANKGAEAALAALEMVSILKSV
ncbi:MAG: 6,7-dimethyl-8-ribityllumazine synthase [Candidatus Melainabacteria bacterium]